MIKRDGRKLIRTPKLFGVKKKGKKKDFQDFVTLSVMQLQSESGKYLLWAIGPNFDPSRMNYGLCGPISYYVTYPTVPENPDR